MSDVPRYMYRVSHITRIEDGEKFLDTPLFAHEQKHYVILCGFAYFQSILWTVKLSHRTRGLRMVGELPSLGARDTPASTRRASEANGAVVVWPWCL